MVDRVENKVSQKHIAFESENNFFFINDQFTLYILKLANHFYIIL